MLIIVVHRRLVMPRLRILYQWGGGVVTRATPIECPGMLDYRPGRPSNFKFFYSFSEK
jgi:hypothetical protein